MGEVGAPMALVLWGPDEEDSESERGSIFPPHLPPPPQSAFMNSKARKRGDTDSSGVGSVFTDEIPEEPPITPLAKTESGSTARRRTHNQNRAHSGLAEQENADADAEAESRDAHASFDLDDELGLAMEMVTDSSDDGLESECEWDGWALDLPRQERKVRDAHRMQQQQQQLQQQIQTQMQTHSHLRENGYPGTPMQSHFVPTLGRERLGSAPSSLMVPPSTFTSPLASASESRVGGGVGVGAGKRSDGCGLWNVGRRRDGDGGARCDGRMWGRVGRLGLWR